MGIASDTLARISREQWTDYKQRFIPLENQLIGAYDNPQLRAERQEAVTGEAAAASDNAMGMAARFMSRYGQSDDSADNGRAAALTKTANIVDAQNVNRDKMTARDQLLLSGGLTSRGV